jgi:Allene oxide cyclase barrel like domain
MTRLVTLMVLSIALIATLAEASSQRIHVTAKVVEATLIGDPDHAKIGDQRITSVELFDENEEHVGTGTGICTLVTTPGPDALVQCYITAVFANGQIIFGGIASLPDIGAVGHFGIFGGTGDFRLARGEATLVVLSSELEDATFDLE